MFRFSDILHDVRTTQRIRALWPDRMLNFDEVDTQVCTFVRGGINLTQARQLEALGVDAEYNKFTKGTTLSFPKSSWGLVPYKWLDALIVLVGIGMVVGYFLQ